MLPLPRLLSKTGSGIRDHAYAPVPINLPSSPFVSHTALVERFWRGYGKHHCVPRSRTTFLFPPLSWHASSYDREKIERLARGKIHSTLFFATRECVSGECTWVARKGFSKKSSLQRLFTHLSVCFSFPSLKRSIEDPCFRSTRLIFNLVSKSAVRFHLSFQRSDISVAISLERA